MVLKAKHIYRVDVIPHRNIHSFKKYALVCPKQDIEIGEVFYGSVYSYVAIDISDTFSENSSINFNSFNFKFSEPSFSDIFEVINKMKEYYKKDKKYRYNFRTKELEEI